MSKRKKHTFTLSEATKKKLVLNLPYCMIGLYATKLGQAWRTAEGTNLSEKLLHLGDGFASAFASSLPSFHPADLLVGQILLGEVGGLEIGQIPLDLHHRLQVLQGDVLAVHLFRWGVCVPGY